MPLPPDPLPPILSWSQLWPSVRAGLGVVLLFGVGLWLTRHYADPLRDALDTHAALGVVVFFVSSVVAVLAPMLTNLPLMPLAVLVWGPAWAGAILLAGWIVGAALSFTLGRHARRLILQRFPSVQRHAGIDRLIDPGHPLRSLILLRMTFPVDVLSYALGLFSRRTTLAQNIVSTTLGAAPFAVLFALFPTLSDGAQLAVFAASVFGFVLYVAWALRHRWR